MGYTFDEDFNYDPETGQAFLAKKWKDGTVDKYVGVDALANSSGQEGHIYRQLDPIGFHRNYRRRGDMRDGIPYRLGRWFDRSVVNSPTRTWVGRAMGDNALQSGAVLGGLGLLGGYAGNWMLRKLGLASDPRLHLIGGIGGLGLGGLIGYLRSQDAEPDGFQKTAAMYRDPRNFILEKLGIATDLSPAQKAQLAAQIRHMDRHKADRLAGMVRAALGFGVGALIARFFGMNLKGTLLGGAAGVIGGGILRALSRPGGFTVRNFL